MSSTGWLFIYFVLFCVYYALSSFEFSAIPQHIESEKDF